MYEETLKRDFQSTAPADESVLPLDDSILASWVRSICQTARGYGVVPEEIMKRSMMNVSLLSVPAARYPAVSVRNFWEQILKACGDNLFGLRCGAEMQVSALHGLGLAIITEIAYSVGFSELSNFSRKCYQWFGASPVTYRKRIQSLQN